MKDLKFKVVFNISYCLIILLLFSGLTICFASPDEYGNQIVHFSVYQRELGSLVQRGETVYVEDYVSSLEIEVNEGQSIQFYVRAYLNSTLATYANTSITQAIGLQFFQDEIYQNPLVPQLPFGMYEDFWNIVYISEEIDYSIDESALVNITYWIDYHNGSSWLLVDEYTFDLVEIEGSEYIPPEVSEDYFDFRFIYFWGFIASCLLSPFLIASGIKFMSAKLSIIGVVFIIIGIGFYIMLAG